MTSRRAEVRQGSPLTPREREGIAHLANGLSNQEIADVLGISKNTVLDYTQVIFERLGVRGRVGAAVWAVRNGIV
jgi:two-component system, NarL family, nitrate/nitrite response regulator NarL